MNNTVNENLENILAQIDLNSPIPEEGDIRQYYFMKMMRSYTSDFEAAHGRKPSACAVTFGCQMNARDSEKLLGILAACGYTITESEAADFVIYNTCTVRDNADQHLYGRLGQVTHIKRSNKDMKVAICGCMMQEPSAVEKIKKSYRAVDLIFGTHNLHCFPEYLYRCTHEKKMVIALWDKTDYTNEALPTKRAFSYKSGINIMYGCNNFCSYCIVPYVRGRERSRDAREILQEIERLAADGVKEIMLLGQNVNSYGKGIENSLSFSELLQEVCKVEGIKRVRFMTSHPKDLSDDLIEVIKNNEKVARQIHLPLQSGSDRILKVMNRRYTKEQYINLALKIREQIPEVALSTDIIVGFPGETEADVLETIDVVKKVGFDNAFTFIYSMRSGTPAAKMEQVPEEEKHRNFDMLLKVVQDTAKERAALLKGKVMSALIEEINANEEGYVTGRLSNNMIVHVPGDASMIGHFYPVSLDECRGFYYFGKIVGPECEV